MTSILLEASVAPWLNSSTHPNETSHNGTWGDFPRGSGFSDDPIDKLERISTPIVCLVGTVLNLLTVGVFLSKSLRSISCSLYLATRSLAVVGALISIMVGWSNALTTGMNTEVVCEVTIFLSYFCPFVSVWMVAVISAENFIRIAQPARVRTLCTPVVAKIVIGTCVVTGLLVYNFPLWTSRVISGQCNVLQQFFQVVLVFNYIDAGLTLFCPFVLMIVVVPLVGLSAIAAYKRKKRLRGNYNNIPLRREQSMDSKTSPEYQVTRLLLAVSLVFLVLHTPFHIIRIKVFILALTGRIPSGLDMKFLQIFRLLYNLDTCASCAVYLIFGNNFRRVFLDMYFSCSLCRSTSHTPSPLTACWRKSQRDAPPTSTDVGRDDNLLSVCNT